VAFELLAAKQPACSWTIRACRSTLPNGKEATEVKPPGVTGVKSLSFGWQRWQTGGGDGEMWIDDSAIGDKQFGCD